MQFFLGIFVGFCAVEKNRFLLALSSNSCSVGCESDYHLIDGICLKISDHRPPNSMKTWDEAKTICENEGAKLAVITSSVQDFFLKNNSKGLPIWIGIKLAGPGTWTDVDNTQRTGFRVNQPFLFV